jgi:hypothetical protein
MGIDRLGGKGPTRPPQETGGASKTTEAGRPFEVGKPALQKAEDAAQAQGVAAPRTALERLKAGEVGLDGYLDLKVDEATAHLRGLPPVELDAVRRSLRARISSDPTLVDLVRTATGAVPPPPGDE